MKINPDNAGWAVVGALVAGGVLAYVGYRAMQPLPAGAFTGPAPAVPPPEGCQALAPVYHDGVLAGTWVDDGQGGCVLQCKQGFQLAADGKSCVPLLIQPAPTNCGALPADADAPYGWESDGQGGCQPKAAPPEAQQCSDRQIWTGSKCETPAWNRLPEPPPSPETLWMPADQSPAETQIAPQDADALDTLGYTTNSDGVFAFQADFNLINSLLIEQGSGSMGGLLLNEDGQIRNEVRQSMGWAIAYEIVATQAWMDLVERAEELAG